MKLFTARLATWRQNRVSIRELSSLSTRELDDLGIGRADIRAVASGAPVMTSEEIEPLVAYRLAFAAGAERNLPRPTWTMDRPTSLAA